MGITLKQVEMAAYAVIGVAAVALPTLASTHPEWTWIGGAVALVNALTAYHSKSQATLDQMSEKDNSINRLTSIVAADVSRKQ